MSLLELIIWINLFLTHYIFKYILTNSYSRVLMLGNPRWSPGSQLCSQHFPSQRPLKHLLLFAKIPLPIPALCRRLGEIRCSSYRWPGRTRFITLGNQENWALRTWTTFWLSCQKWTALVQNSLPHYCHTHHWGKLKERKILCHTCLS